MKLIEQKQLAGMNIHYRFYSLEYFLEAQVRAGFRTIELWAGSPHFFLSNLEYDDCKKIKKMIRDRNLEVKVITPENCSVPYQFAASDPELYRRSFDYFKKGLDAGEELGCRIMAVHSGRGNLNEDREEAWKRGRDMLARLADYAQTKDITLAMESLRPQETNLATTLKDVKRMIDEIHHPNFKAMIDTTAMGVAGENPEQWFQVLGSDIVHMHFIDGTPYGHLIWGDGRHNLKEWLETLNRHQYQGLLSQEITAQEYYWKPAEADRRNYAMFRPFME
ncbi:MAG: sugar phosphate isomerase/epimerase [Lachnospiraceae bacterium]|nr:sugar phosphate isomerase/epimerase [Lachnospiraceae bacterium]